MSLDALISENGPCYAMLWAYDKGALTPHRLPDDAGFRVGKGTRYSQLMLQIHYQLPPLRTGSDGSVTLLTTADLQAARYRDSSGVRVSLARAQAQRSNAWSLEFMAYNMLIPPGARGLEYSNRLPSDMMQKILGPEFRHANGTLRLWQVHAHAHGHARRVELLRERDGVSETLYAIEPYCGVGDCQHFHDLPHTESDGGPPTLRPGDSLEFRCTYDNDGRFEIGYGVSAMQEMCGPILIYTPHDLDYHGQTWYEHVGGMVRDGRGQGPWALSGFHRPTRLDFPEHVGGKKKPLGHNKAPG